MTSVAQTKPEDNPSAMQDVPTVTDLNHLLPRLWRAEMYALSHAIEAHPHDTALHQLIREHWAGERNQLRVSISIIETAGADGIATRDELDDLAIATLLRVESVTAWLPPEFRGT